MPCVAIVGARRPTVYGLEVANRLAKDLALAGVAIVSGLARGIDGAAHVGALDAEGKTWAVLGSGLDCVYPKEHERLAERILKGYGALISEYPLGFSPKRSIFQKEQDHRCPCRRSCRGRSGGEKRDVDHGRFRA